MAGQLYNIQLVAEIVGVSVHTLRAWEKRYKTIVPSRASNGRRLYSEQDIAKLELLAQVVTKGGSIGRISHLSISELQELLKKITSGYQAEHQGKEIKQELSRAEKQLNPEFILPMLMNALSRFKLDILAHELEKLKEEVPIPTLIFKILQPLLVEIGREIEKGTFNIFQEHALSAILRFKLGELLYNKSSLKKRSGQKIILCAPEEEQHEFGILFAALLVHFEKIPYFYLGPNLPADSLVMAQKELQADRIVIGFSPYFAAQHTSKLLSYLLNVANHTEERVKIYIGGPSLQIKKHLLKYKNIFFVESLEDFHEKIKTN